jgi:hypothetical protein
MVLLATKCSKILAQVCNEKNKQALNSDKEVKQALEVR